jgi:hypothetical protein
MRTTHGFGALLALPGLVLACGSEPDPGAADAAAALPIGGRYEVSGVTVDLESGHKREIAGTVILVEQGDGYTSTFDLATMYPGADQALPAEVIGKGDGSIDGRTLRGTASTQLVMATVPNVDPGFAFIPRMVGAKIESTTVAVIAADGTVSIEIENRPAPGEDYAPTRTTLSGRRVASAGPGDRLAKETGAR